MCVRAPSRLLRLSPRPPPAPPLSLLPQLAAALAADERWQDWIVGRLESRNALENVYAWQCGRPQMAEAGGGDGYPGDADFQGLASDAFSRDVYQRWVGGRGWRVLPAAAHGVCCFCIS